MGYTNIYGDDREYGLGLSDYRRPSVITFRDIHIGGYAMFFSIEY